MRSPTRTPPVNARRAPITPETTLAEALAPDPNPTSRPHPGRPRPTSSAAPRYRLRWWPS